MFPYTKLILALGAGVAVATTGTAYRIDLPVSDQNTVPTLQLYGTITQAGGADTPVGQVLLQTSPDGVTWLDIIMSLWATDAAETVTTTTSVTPMKYIRLKVIPSGGTPPTLTGNFWIGSNRPVTFNAV